MLGRVASAVGAAALVGCASAQGVPGMTAAEVWEWSCAGCHGPGAEHILGRVVELSDAELDDANLEMLIGPGGWGDDPEMARELSRFLRGLAGGPREVAAGRRAVVTPISASPIVHWVLAGVEWLVGWLG